MKRQLWADWENVLIIALNPRGEGGVGGDPGVLEISDWASGGYNEPLERRS